jgi:hypothetical protein
MPATVKRQLIDTSNVQFQNRVPEKIRSIGAEPQGAASIDNANFCSGFSSLKRRRDMVLQQQSMTYQSTFVPILDRITIFGLIDYRSKHLSDVQFDGDGRINCCGRSMNALRQLSFVIVDRLIDEDNTQMRIKQKALFVISRRTPNCTKLE